MPKLTSPTSPLVAIAILILLALLGGGIFFALRGGGAASRSAASAPDAGRTGVRSSSLPAQARPPGDSRPAVRKLVDRAARDRLLRAIAQARARRRLPAESTGSSSRNEPAPALESPVLDRKYIQKTMRGVLTLLKECYELAAADTPNLSGRLMVQFEIEGEPEVGGIVTTAEVMKDAKSPLGNNATLSECVRETVMSLEFAPPESGGKVVVRYPFTFRGGDEGSPGNAK